MISKTLLYSDIGLTIKGDDNLNYHIATNSITTTTPLANVEISLYSLQGQNIGKGFTNLEGLCKIATEIPCFFAIARKNNEYAAIKTEASHALLMSKFDVGGSSNTRGVKGFLYAERGVWRPGDTAYFNFILPT